MNDNHSPGDDGPQPGFGRLDAASQAALRNAVAEDAELAAAAQGLEAAVAAVRAENPGRVGERFNERLRQRTSELFDHAPPEPARPKLPVPVLTTWRWIMRSPVSRVAAAAALVVAVTGVALWFHGAGTTPVFADFLAPIIKAKTAKFTLTSRAPGQPTTKCHVMVLGSARLRMEFAKTVMIADHDMGKSIFLVPGEKQATVITNFNSPKEKPVSFFFVDWRSQLREFRDKLDFKREPLGTKEIDGHRCVGYRLTGHGMTVDLWGDPKTGQPIRMGLTWLSTPSIETTVSDFAFDTDMDESLFSLEPPPGYKVKYEKADVSPAEEKDLIETFRSYSQLSGGALPDKLDILALTSFFETKWGLSHPSAGRRSDDNQKDAERREMINGLRKLTRGIDFVFERLPPEADAHYAGKGVSVGAADRPVFWYRPKDNRKYRVIYADLSVRDADTRPDVPDAQPLPAPSSPKK
jgi:outer membrane lipoprotein-sorting protein